MESSNSGNKKTLFKIILIIQLIVGMIKIEASSFSVLNYSLNAPETHVELVSFEQEKTTKYFLDSFSIVNNPFVTTSLDTEYKYEVIYINNLYSVFFKSTQINLVVFNQAFYTLQIHNPHYSSNDDTHLL